MAWVCADKWTEKVSILNDSDLKKPSDDAIKKLLSESLTSKRNGYQDRLTMATNHLIEYAKANVDCEFSLRDMFATFEGIDNASYSILINSANDSLDEFNLEIVKCSKMFCKCIEL